MMYCMNCGQQLPDGAKFCHACGTATGTTGAAVPGQPGNRPAENIQIKLFSFGGFTYNRGAIQQINNWLKETRMTLKSISMNTFMNTNLPLKWETVPSRLELKYAMGTGTDTFYQMGYFASKSMFGASYDKVDQLLEAWKTANPDKRVVWVSHTGHQSNQGSTQSLYYIYTIQ